MPKFVSTMVMLIALLYAGMAAALDDAIMEAARRIETESAAHRLVVLGEMHGTQEIPDLVEQLAARYAQQGPLLLGLEASRGEHAALRGYLQSEGGPDARRALLASGFWQVPAERHDGRRSEDMLDLIDSLRKLRAQGRDVAILPFDVTVSGRGAQARDRAMADYLRHALHALPRGRLLVLTGNVHAMRWKADYCPQCQTPMTWLLRDLQPFAVEINAAEGAFRACRDGACGPLAVQRSVPGIAVFPPDSRTPYHVRVVLPRFTPATLVSMQEP